MLTAMVVTAVVMAQTKEPIVQPMLPALPLKDVSGLLSPIRENHKLPGLAAAVVYEGHIVARGCTGVRAVGREEKVTLEDRWHLGSCTKAMTATLAAVMVEKGEVKWETTLGEVFSEVAMKEAWKAVTLRQLTTNHGGVPTGLEKDGLWGKLWRFTGTPTGARLELLKGVTANEPEAAPGTKYIYSNGGFAMAGAMLESKSGKGWEELVTERVFKPLKITTAGFGAPGTKGKFDQPCGHRGGKAVEPGPGADNPVAIGPAGIVNMTIEDWARFAMAHADGEWVPKDAGEGHAGEMLGPEAWKLLHTPYVTGVKGEKDEYAGGWIVTTRPWAKGKGEKDTGRVLNHSGSNTMWYCVAWVAPERRFAVVAACNQGDGEAPKATDEAVWALIQDTLLK